MSIPSEPQPDASQLTNWHVKLRQILESYFEQSDLEALCFDLRLDYESLAGDTKTRKIIELIQTFARTGRIGELIDWCSRQRKNIPWDELRAAADRYPLVVEEEPDRGWTGRASERPADTSLRTSRSAPSGKSNSSQRTIVLLAAGLVGLIVLMAAVFIFKPAVLFPRSTATPTLTPTPTLANTPTPTIAPSPTATPTSTVTSSPTAEPSPTATPMPTATNTPPPTTQVPRELKYISSVATLRAADLFKRTQNVHTLLREIINGQVTQPGPLNRVNDLNNNLADLWLKIAGYGLGADPYLDNIFFSSSGFSRATLPPDFGMPAEYISLGLPRLYERYLEVSGVSSATAQRRQNEFAALVKAYDNPEIYPHRDFYERAYASYRLGNDLTTRQYASDLQILDKWLSELETVLRTIPKYFPAGG